MAIRVALHHFTQYQYDRPVELSPHVVRLRPAPHSRTPIRGYSLRIKPEKHFINWQQDPFGNYLARLVFLEKTRELSIEVEVIAEMTVINPFDFFLEKYADYYPFQYDDQARKELTPYLEIVEKGPRLLAWLELVDRSKNRTVDFLVDLNQRLQKNIEYTVRLEPGIQSCEETLTKASGSCRDSAWLLTQIVRHLGLAARFVSGYLVQLKSDVASLDGPSGPAEDFTDLHAWCEVYVPGAGWIGLDPTSGLFAGESHIPLACTPDAVSAAPVTGSTDDCEVKFFHSNEVVRIHEDPRVTKPYTDAQWAAINALGNTVDRQLRESDVRLTMGGEPTFVSIDDMESEQWNTAALGEHKRSLAGDLLKRLYARFAPGAVLHYGQGKWYPGEALPRWSLGCFWRKDGVPIWRKEALIAADGVDYGVGVAQTKRFAEELARHLCVHPRNLVPAYEDTLYYLWKEGNVPHNLDPLDINLKDSRERQNLARVLQQGLDEAVGYVLPLKWNDVSYAWHSAPWTLRRGRLFLMPGDSPLGLRLPLESLPWVAKEKRDLQEERSQFEPLPALADFHGEVAQRYSFWEHSEYPHPEVREQPFADTAGSEDARADEAWVQVPHTAVCIEPRAGQLHIFLPPLTHLEHYLDLVTAIEFAADKLDMPVRLEGYPPPADWRILGLQVTPDPGVIEVNIHPAHDWDELCTNTEILYEEARLARLGTEKFMLDGLHSGTGGGNHVTLGGPTPSDSPLLRRPDLLRSLVTYWQHHPGLSYLFSGLFIGPTSQAPRVDEGRDEKLYELEIAFSQMPDGEVAQPWLVDRLMRHLLTDITGNTHRAEFCIDKLYSPDTTSGRQGLLEFRGFEMPPHPRMSLVQMLLLRTLIAWFWKSPYKKPLVRWGTELHDRFMLPHYVQRDIQDVVLDLEAAGYDFCLDWLAPFLEFRFPHYGTVNIGDIQIDLHRAIEPWHVLGEEVSNIGTARFVDSSMERLQVRLRGLTDSRYVLTCNRKQMPIHNTGTHGEYIGGVRYRAWNPPSALHPTIGVQAPLVFDIVDTWNGRSLGGCTYHVSHPGGRGYDIFPVNAFEAETRRISRFWDFGHTQGAVDLPPITAGVTSRTFIPEGSPPGSVIEQGEEISPEFPYTLDLRRFAD